MYDSQIVKMKGAAISIGCKEKEKEKNLQLFTFNKKNLQLYPTTN